MTSHQFFALPTTIALILSAVLPSSGQTIIPDPVPLTPQQKVAEPVIPALTIDPGLNMEKAVEVLRDALTAAKLAPLNVVYERGIDSLQVPGVELRQVTGPDALRLIARSAGCEAEPIPGVRPQQTIGYMLRRKEETAFQPFATGIPTDSLPLPTPTQPARKWTTTLQGSRSFDPSPVIENPLTVLSGGDILRMSTP